VTFQIYPSFDIREYRDPLYRHVFYKLSCTEQYFAMDIQGTDIMDRRWKITLKSVVLDNVEIENKYYIEMVR